MLAEKRSDEKDIDYSKIASSASFKQLLQEKKKFLLPMSIFFFVFYFTLPIMTSYSTILNTSAIGDISWAWVFAFSQFIMTWVLCSLYSKKAESFDKQADEIVHQSLKEADKK
ncbi:MULTISPECIES: DUF485 domain-containing protein [Fictibacillus]|uniref:DUF485 domain-containing protein n=1 Tax=Fictibacillus terranigra TaxID=3058424 RepID=A0ABT8E5Q8_9BACL|nr:DUF485 domain-containing protein [Fictibacillus sp. CENA-BCM004]MDN4073247.1 DUF485 domain-containing protein [Fictibacillus sp. CENA-BCM004]